MKIERLFDILPNYLEKYPWKTDALAMKENKEWKTFSIQEYAERVKFLSYGLIKLGVKPGDRIVTITPNRPAWNFADMAIMQVGAIHVPVYPTISASDYEFIFKHSEVKIVMVSGKELYHKIKDILPNCPMIEKVYTFTHHSDLADYHEISDLGQENPNDLELKARMDDIGKDDIATIIYTSGTTGKMKGVMLSHDNILSNVDSIKHIPPGGPNARGLSFLPLCHIYERTINYVFQLNGMSVYYAENVATVVENAKEIKANILPTVPRLLEKIYDKIDEKGSKLTGIKKAIFDWSVNLGLKYDIKGENSFLYNIQLAIARKLVFKKWQEALGGEVKALIVGGAAMQPRLGRLFNAAGVPTLEGYGLTETSPVISVNDWGKNKSYIGTVGPIIKNAECKIADDGEIIVKGPGVMKGYYKEPEMTADVIDKEGWFHTGDLGMFVENRFLKITGRKKDIFKSSFGKYIAPAPIEAKLKESHFIEEVMIVGENQKFAGALIIPNFEYIRQWCKQESKNCPEDKDLINSELIKKQIQSEINSYNSLFAEHEKVKTFTLLSDKWDLDSGLVTAKLSLKRPAITTKYQEIIEEMFK